MRRLASVLVLLALLILSGRSGDDGRPLPEWSLVTAGGESTLTLAARVDGRLPRGGTYRLKSNPGARANEPVASPRS